MQDNDIQKLTDRVSKLELESFGPSPVTHPLTVAQFKYQMDSLGGTSVTGRSRNPSNVNIAVNQGNVPQLLLLQTNTFANGITWDATNHRFTCVTAGVYAISCYVLWNATNIQDGVSYTAGYGINSTTVISVSSYDAATGTAHISSIIYDLVNLAVGDQVTFFMLTGSNASMTPAIDEAIGTITKQ